MFPDPRLRPGTGHTRNHRVDITSPNSTWHRFPGSWHTRYRGDSVDDSSRGSPGVPSVSTTTPVVPSRRGDLSPEDLVGPARRVSLYCVRLRPFVRYRGEGRGDRRDSSSRRVPYPRDTLSYEEPHGEGVRSVIVECVRSGEGSSSTPRIRTGGTEDLLGCPGWPRSLVRSTPPSGFPGCSCTGKRVDGLSLLRHCTLSTTPVYLPYSGSVVQSGRIDVCPPTSLPPVVSLPQLEARRRSSDRSTGSSHTKVP